MGMLKFASINHWLVVRFTMPRVTDPFMIQRMGEELEEKLKALPERGQVVLSFSGVEFVSSQIIGLMLTARNIVTAKHGTLVLCRLCDNARQILTLTRLESQFEIKDGLSDVVGKIKRRQGASPTGHDEDQIDWMDSVP